MASTLLPPLYLKLPMKLLMMDLPPSHKITAIKLKALCWQGGRSTPELELNWLRDYLKLGKTEFYGHMAALISSNVLSWTKVKRGRLIVTFAEWLDSESSEGTAQTSPTEDIPFGNPNGVQFGNPESPGRRINLINKDVKPPTSFDSLTAPSVRKTERNEEQFGNPNEVQFGKPNGKAVLSDEITAELKAAGVFTTALKKVVDAGWSEWQIREVLREVRQTSKTPGALFIYRVEHNPPPIEPGSEADRNKYISGPYSEFVNH